VISFHFRDGFVRTLLSSLQSFRQWFDGRNVECEGKLVSGVTGPREISQKECQECSTPSIPSRQVLLPWGNNENGADYYWLTRGAPKDWMALSDAVRGSGLVRIGVRSLIILPVFFWDGQSRWLEITLMTTNKYLNPLEIRARSNPRIGCSLMSHSAASNLWSFVVSQRSHRIAKFCEFTRGAHSIQPKHSFPT